MIKVGLLGYGKAGKAVARVINADPRFDLCWIAKRSSSAETPMDETGKIPLIGLESIDFSKWLDAHPVDAIQERCITLVSAISSYSPEQIAFVHGLGQRTRVLYSPNMTLGINFLILAAKLLRSIAPFADVEILEQHFKEKPNRAPDP